MTELVADRLRCGLSFFEREYLSARTLGELRDNRRCLWLIAAKCSASAIRQLQCIDRDVFVLQSPENLLKSILTSAIDTVTNDNDCGLSCSGHERQQYFGDCRIQSVEQ